MERAMTVEERIRRAEEIYERRKRNEGLTVSKEEKKNEKKDIKLLKKNDNPTYGLCMHIFDHLYNQK